MFKKNEAFDESRRKFFSSYLPACAFAPLALGGESSCKFLNGCWPDDTNKHKFQKKWERTYAEFFQWRYDYYIDIMEQFATYLGRQKLIEMIRQAVDDAYAPSGTDDPEHTFQTYLQGGGFYKNMMTQRIIQKTEKVYEIHVTECLWYKAFKKRNATDLGYATVCYGDFAEAQKYHSKIKLYRTKTIMQGDGYCNHCWKWED